jgi:mRNA interferase RelE/StbE
MKIRLHKRALKYLETLDAVSRQRVSNALKNLEHEPTVGDIKPLQPYKHHFRLRVGNFRVTFHYEQGIIAVDDIDSRGQIYK